MTISVAAGLGLEQAMQVSCARFESPVCHGSGPVKRRPRSR
jgi:hypothetical protein